MSARVVGSQPPDTPLSFLVGIDFLGVRFVEDLGNIDIVIEAPYAAAPELLAAARALDGFLKGPGSLRFNALMGDLRAAIAAAEEGT